MLKQVVGNILDAREGIICHQVNCMMVMGSGLAKQIKEKYPIVFEEYKRVMGSAESAHRLGKCQIVEISRGTLFVANLFGQYRYGRGACYTDYNALTAALNSLATWYKNFIRPTFPIYIPHGMGCGLAGGEWSVVSGIIKSVIPSAIIVRLNK